MTTTTVDLELDSYESEADRHVQEMMDLGADIAKDVFHHLLCDPRVRGREIEAIWYYLQNRDWPLFPLIERFLEAPNPAWKIELEKARKEYESRTFWHPLPFESDHPAD